jgi:hypothetical protein
MGDIPFEIVVFFVLLKLPVLLGFVSSVQAPFDPFEYYFYVFSREISLYWYRLNIVYSFLDTVTLNNLGPTLFEICQINTKHPNFSVHCLSIRSDAGQAQVDH